jgi:hypothetical protein
MEGFQGEDRHNPLPHITLSTTALKSAYPKMASMAAHLATELRELQALCGQEWQLLQSPDALSGTARLYEVCYRAKGGAPGQTIAGRLHAAPLA